MNDSTHDDSSFVLDRAITYYCGWSIERRQAGPYVVSDPDQTVVALFFTREEARAAIDEAIERGDARTP